MFISVTIKAAIRLDDGNVIPFGNSILVPKSSISFIAPHTPGVKDSGEFDCLVQEIDGLSDVVGSIIVFRDGPFESIIVNEKPHEIEEQYIQHLKRKRLSVER